MRTNEDEDGPDVHPFPSFSKKFHAIDCMDKGEGLTVGIDAMEFIQSSREGRNG